MLSGEMTMKILKKIEKSFLKWEKMAVFINHERFTLGTANNTIEELQNGAKYINTSKSVSFWLIG